LRLPEPFTPRPYTLRPTPQARIPAPTLAGASRQEAVRRRNWPACERRF
jgi:hypothetical protein